MLADAREKAASIVADAEIRSQEIIGRAQAQADDLRKNTMTEIALAGKQAVARIKEELALAIVAGSTSENVRQANMDPDFVKGMLLAVARNWNGASHEKVTLETLLPEERRREFDAVFAKSAEELLSHGVEVGYSRDVKSGFRVGEKGGGYYIGFSDEDFDALLGQYLRDKTYKLLFGS